MAAVISAEQVSQVYGNGTTALNDVSLQIGTGLFGLLGANGAGKSTLMRIICTVLVPTRGRVLVDGLDVVKQRRDVRRLLGYLPQEFSAWRLLTVREVLDTLAALSGFRHAAERRRRVDQVLESVGLGKVADRKVKQLSGGMTRRLGVAQALVHDPRVLIVDEPTVGLDPEERLRFRQLMAQLGRDRAIVLSTHIVADLGSGCNDLAVLDRGELAFRGAPSELIRQAEGRVVEVTVDDAREDRFAQQMEIVQRQVVDGSPVLRGVTGEAGTITGGSATGGARARVVDDITLEEAYLAFMIGRGRTVDELEVDVQA